MANENKEWIHPLGEIVWKFQGDGRAWNQEEVNSRYGECPARIELIYGKLFWREEDRVMLLGMLLENVGLDSAVRLGDPQAWRDAIAKLDSETLKEP